MTDHDELQVDRPLIVSWGAGLNSTALIIGLLERDIRPDAILFANTHGEKPATYRFLEVFTDWLKERDLDLVVVDNAAREGFPHTSLENECHNNQTLPSLAFGFKGCSAKWKRQPQERWAKQWQPAIDAWERGDKVTKAIGFDAWEERRAKIPEDNEYRYIYPLIEWGWGRDECTEAIEREGLCPPPKSACFFCPASKKSEILQLKRKHPDLFQRAMDMERHAAPALGTVKGLGRAWSWTELGDADDAQLRLLPNVWFDEPCGCYDGEYDE